MRTRRFERWLPALAAALVAALTTGVAIAQADDDDDDERSYVVGLWGDVPYSDAQTTVGLPNLIADMNRSSLAFSVHDGDIKAGGTACNDAVYARFEGFLNALRAPAMYTPGDNEWTDCDRNPAFTSAERLAFIRANLFDTNRSFGKRKLKLEVQAAPYVENRRWHFGDVTYATLHVVGTDNNRSGDVAPDPAEWAARDAATNNWLSETFDAAEQRHSAAVMLVIQGGMAFDSADPTRAAARNPQTLEPQDGYFNFLKLLRAETLVFGKPVVLVHGDSHYFRVDKPLLDANGHRIESFTRVETPGNNAQSGSNDVQWVSVEVDPRDGEVFSFQQEIVPANLQAYQP